MLVNLFLFFFNNFTIRFVFNITFLKLKIQYPDTEIYIMEINMLKILI
jgi:hypothetical protein